MDTLKERVISGYIAENYPNARIVNWDDPDSGLVFYTADQLHQVDGDWFPLCAHLDPVTQKVVYGGQSRIVHTYTEGETGAGKTTRFAMQSIRALSSMKNKPSFLVVDIHGELVENLYDHLKRQGYTVRILNCDDPSRSDTYNPFTVMARRCMEAGEIDNQTINEIRKIADIIQPIESTKDPIWDQGARSYANGAILDKFEDLIDRQIPPECITLYNIIENHYWLRQKLSATRPTSTSACDLLRIPHYRRKGARALSVQKMISVTNNAEKTMMSYFGVVENRYDAFGQPTLYQLSSNSTIDIDQFIEEPTAIFIQSGSTAIADDLLSLMTNEIYNTVVRKGRESATKLLPRKIHCFLDEFANSQIAEGPEFIRMLTTSRKFGMYWHMLLQCDAQLERKFDRNMARIIRANCTEIFMGSHDYETTVRFAGSCGKKTVENLSSRVAQNTPVLTTVDLVTPDRLSLIEEGWVYIKTNRRPLLYSYIEAFYKCPEFTAAEDIRSVYPVNSFRYQDTYFTPDDIKPPLTRDEFLVLRYICENSPVGYDTIADVLDGNTEQAGTVLEKLMECKYVRIDDEWDQVLCLLLPAEYHKLSKDFPDVPRRPIITALTPEEFEILSRACEHRKNTVREMYEDFPEQDVRRITGKLERLRLIRVDRARFLILPAIDETQYMKIAQKSGFPAEPSADDPVYTNFLISAQIAKGYPNVDLSALEALTCVPGTVLNYVRYVMGKAPFDPARQIVSLDTLRFEIIEAFIIANDFPDKARWDRAFAAEYQVIKQLDYLPDEIIACFQRAMTEFRNDQSIENIREIKRIVSGQEDNGQGTE